MIDFFKSNLPDSRQFKRLKTPIKVKFKIISGENPIETSTESKGIVNNISLDGFSLEAGLVQIGRFHISHDSSMMKKNRIGIKLQLSQEEKSKTSDIINVLGEVIWYDKTDLNPQYPYHVGVQVLEISEEDKSKLETSINNNWPNAIE